MLYDTHLNVDPLSQETVPVVVTSDSDVAGIKMTLTEISVDSDSFTSTATGLDLTFDLISSSEPLGRVQVADGDIVTVTYQDFKPVVARSDTATWWISPGPCSLTPTPSDVSSITGSKKIFILMILGLVLMVFIRLHLRFSS